MTSSHTIGEGFAYVRWVISEPFRAAQIRLFWEKHAPTGLTYFIAWRWMNGVGEVEALADDKQVQP